MKRVQGKDIPGFDFPIPDVTGWPKKGVLLELGTLLGQSAVIWAETFEANDMDWRIVTIDSCGNMEPPETVEGLSEGQLRAMQNYMRARGLVVSGKEKEKQIKNNLKGWPNITFRKEQIKFDDKFTFNLEPALTAVYYDMLHTYEANKWALERFKHLDYIYIDDYGPHFPGTIQAVDEHVELYNKHLEIVVTDHGNSGQARITKR